MININTIDNISFEFDGETISKEYELKQSGFDDKVSIVNINHERDIILNDVSIFIE